MEISLDRRKFIRFLVAIAILLIALSVAANAYKLISGHTRYLVKLFDLDHEANFPTLFRALCIFGVALILFGIGLSEKGVSRARSRAWKVLSFAFLYVGTDDILTLHEACITALRSFLKTGGYLHFAWVIPWGFAALGLGLYLHRFFNTLPKRTRMQFYISAGMFLLGAVGFEMIGGKIFTSLGESNVWYVVTTQSEEVLEMMGVLVFLNALLDYIKTSFLSINVKIL